MSVLLFGVGAFALFAGLVMVGFGIPINEFSFGNTLIIAGTTAAVGGLIIIGFGVVAGNCSGSPRRWRWRQPAGPVQAARGRSKMPAAAARPAPAQGRPVPEQAEASASTVDPLPGRRAHRVRRQSRRKSRRPTLRNPDEFRRRFEEEISLSPPHPTASAAGRLPMTSLRSDDPRRCRLRRGRRTPG